MGKRSRDASFSPSADDKWASSPSQENLNQDIDCTRPTKLATVPNTSDSKFEREVVKCTLPPHRDAIEFPNVDAFEIHYLKEHSNRCSSCSKNFPTEHFLMLHIDENHNPVREGLQAKGEKTYACFVESCDRKCSTPHKRRLHLIDKHAFPRLYDFQIVNTGIDKSVSMLKDTSTRRRRLSTASKHPEQVRQDQPQTFEIGKATQAKSDLRNDVVKMQRSPDASISDHQPESISIPVVSDKASGTSVTEDGPMASLQRSMSALRFVPHSVTNRQRNQTIK